MTPQTRQIVMDTLTRRRQHIEETLQDPRLPAHLQLDLRATAQQIVAAIKEIEETAE